MTTNSSGTSLRNGGVERAFSPFGCSARLTWGVAPGWNETRRWRWGGEWKPPTIVRFWGGGAGGRFVGPVARRDGRVARATLSNFGVRVEAIRRGDHSGVIANGTTKAGLAAAVCRFGTRGRDACATRRFACEKNHKIELDGFGQGY